LVGCRSKTPTIVFLEHSLFSKFRLVSILVLFSNSDCVYARKRGVQSFEKRDKDVKRRESKEKICVWKRKEKKREDEREKEKKEKKGIGMARKI
jgi:hypothetical protein